ncbi:TerC family protein [Lactobacillus sp. AN1001]|uniref:Integral membrane protein, YkoY family n=3 Tax=Ligilactobacillus animalis TaxID=1605 RepID=A0AAJ6FYE6_9LACO|nr:MULTISPECIES: TerC family protein [Ligilactobacillus]KDA46854.1 integral membrane protein, YkoY family [Ligilactobacillus animalis]KRM57454.1 tellurium resistance protein [Ligilactobacillus animalis KCTC 3501 = DSM 20602]MBU5279689.1 TerC family protein [Ligilactobacillus animalis]MCI5941996.1 TerC family protein [Ligilactobacillus animalis]MDO5884134.1 TerC family protein [Ligilactobacillus animalis]
MDILTKLYGPFFDVNNWKTVIESGEDWMIIFSLVLIECLLSVDNAIVLAAQTQKLPDKKQQEKSLFYGLWGAYIFRFALIGVGSYLIHFWEIKVLGAGYLMYLSLNHFYRMKYPERAKRKKGKKRKPILPLFWSVVISIELMDIVFSIDSILASLAISPNPVIVLIGGLIGILCMRGIAEVIMRLIDIVPELEVMAYFLIGLIAIKLFLTIPMIDIEIPAAAFGIVVLASVVVTLVVHKVRN